MSEQITPHDSASISASMPESSPKELTGVDAVLSFLRQCKEDPALISRFEFDHCLELIFSLKLLGLFTTQSDWRQVIGPMEYFVITQKHKEELNESSSLWPRMYGKTFLRYVVETFSTLTEDDVNRFMANHR